MFGRTFTCKSGGLELWDFQSVTGVWGIGWGKEVGEDAQLRVPSYLWTSNFPQNGMIFNKQCYPDLDDLFLKQRQWSQLTVRIGYSLSSTRNWNNVVIHLICGFQNVPQIVFLFSSLVWIHFHFSFHSTDVLGIQCFCEPSEKD